MRIIEPEVGCWYKSQLENCQFEVVAFDDDDESIEIQYFDGDVEELDKETWYRMELSSIAAPEDWSGPYEMESDELGHEAVIHPENWNLLNEFDIDEEL